MPLHIIAAIVSVVFVIAVALHGRQVSIILTIRLETISMTILSKFCQNDFDRNHCDLDLDDRDLDSRDLDQDEILLIRLSGWRGWTSCGSCRPGTRSSTWRLYR